MGNRMIFYCSDSSWATRTFAFVSGGYSYRTIQEILSKVKENLDPGEQLGQIEILGHGSEGVMSFGGTGNSPGPSSIATSTGTIVHDPGVHSFWTSLRSHLAPVSVVVLNSCNVGRGRSGEYLLREIAKLTGAIVCGALKDMTSEIGMHYFNDPLLYKKVYPPSRSG